jgi:hypothetical protein
MTTQNKALTAVIILMAATSLITMIFLFQIDRIVNGDLYNYDLQFSLGWALPYWTYLRIALALGWINIIAATAAIIYTAVRGRRKAEQPTTDTVAITDTVTEPQKENQKPKTKPKKTTEKPKDETTL